ncbi:MAG: hypothetical protein M1817_005203, partial [Caeruleum heppii]
MSSRDATSCGGINIEHLHQVLSDLTSNPNPHVPNPPDVPKRASVALILRIHPRYGHWPDHPVEPQRLPSGTQPLSTTDHLDHFFQQDWIRQGDPEILFIKRAARQGDRWTSHVAFPGGKRDPVDEDDVAAAVRETWEEVGLDLAGEHAIYVGNLAERVVTTSWGTRP